MRDDHPGLAGASGTQCDEEEALAGYERLWRPAVNRRQRSARRTARWFVPATPRQLRLRRLALRLADLPVTGDVAGTALAGRQRPYLRQLAAVPAWSRTARSTGPRSRPAEATRMARSSGEQTQRAESRMPSSTGPGPSLVTARLRQALETADRPLLAELLHPNVHGSPPEGGATGCHTRSHVLSRCARLHALGLRANAEETFACPMAAVLGLRILGPVPRADPQSVGYHVFGVAGGLITRITGYTDRAQVLEAAFAGTPVESAADWGRLQGHRSGASG
ncbi:hypothetical protein [Streptomyces sp. NPDC086777]|uniref:hypothetical protein n=1 Tax=Streptomyces sp. NPDC086777 TaxID=3154866 RepID=UPI00344F0794